MLSTNLPPPKVPDHELLKLIGRGSYGEVWLARNVMGTYRAVKIVRRSTFEEAIPYDREFNGICKFEPISRSQRNQLQVLHVGRNDEAEYFYYVMELADSWRDEVVANNLSGQSAHRGVDPADYVPYTLQQRIKAQGRLPFADCLEIILALAEALNNLHRNKLVHRDIKPSNIIFVERVPKLADIGLVTESDATLSCSGAEGFTAPEGTGRPPADVYSLGKVLYEMCTGVDRMNFPSLPSGFDSWSGRSEVMELITISLKACEPQPSDRYASADELIADLVFLQAGKSVLRLRLLERVFRRLMYVGPIVILIVIGAFFLFQMRNNLQKAEILAQGEKAKRLQAQRLIQQRKLLEGIQYTRLLPRFSGWFEKSWRDLDAASQIRADEDVRDHAAALLAGLDATHRYGSTNFGASAILFNETGNQIFATDVDEPARLLNTTNGLLLETASPKPGLNTLGFWQKNVPVHAIFDQADDAIVISDINTPPHEYARLHLAEAADAKTSVVPEIVQLSPDAGSLAAILLLGQDTHNLAIWTTSPPRLIFQKPLWGTRIAFSRDSSLLAISAIDGSVLIHAMKTSGSEELTIQSGQNNILSLALSSGEKNRAALESTLAIGDANGTIGIWDVQQKTHVATCFGGYKVDAVTFSPDGTIIAGGGSEPVRLWDAATGNRLLHIQTGYGTKGLQFSPDGKQLAVAANHGYSPNNVEVWDLEFGRGIDLLYGLSRRVEKIAISPNSQTLAAISHLWEIALWDLQTKQLLHKIRVPPGTSVDNCALAFSPDSSQLAFCAGKKGMVWDKDDGSLKDSWEFPPGLRDCLTFNSEGKLVISRTESIHSMLAPKLYLRDCPHSAWAHPEVQLPLYDDILSLLLVDSGKLLIIDGLRRHDSQLMRNLTAYETETGHVQWSVEISKSDTFSTLADSHNGSIVLKFGGDLPIVVDLLNGSLKQHDLDVPCCFSPGGTLSASYGRYDRGLLISAPFEGRQLVTLAMDHSLVAGFSSFDSRGNLVATGDRDGTVMVCDLNAVNNHLKSVKLGWNISPEELKKR